MSTRTLARHLLLSTALASPAFSQNVLFAENFDAGIPATWSNRHLGIAMDPWFSGISPATNSPDVFHDWFCNHGFYFRDNLLVSPRIDLTGFTRAEFSCVQHQSFPAPRVLNRVEVSTDGGATFVPLYNETGTWTGPGTIRASLDAYAGRLDVRIAFHYQGTIANEWRIDDVRVTTRQPIYSITGLVAGGSAAFAVRGAPPGELVLLAFSLTGSGPLPTTFGIIHMTPPIHVLPFQYADPTGNASTQLAIPSAAIGMVVDAQAAVLLPNGAVHLSNFFTTRVQ